MMIKNLLISSALSIMFSSSALEAQVQEAEKLRTGNNDLREQKALFEVRSHRKAEESLALLMNGNNQYLLDVSNGNERLKVSNEFAQKADGTFVSNFIQLKYGSEKRKEKVGAAKCESAFTLFMRGEKHQVCADEEKKVSQVLGMLRNFKNELKLD